MFANSKWILYNFVMMYFDFITNPETHLCRNFSRGMWNIRLLTLSSKFNDIILSFRFRTHFVKYKPWTLFSIQKILHPVLPESLKTIGEKKTGNLSFFRYFCPTKFIYKMRTGSVAKKRASRLCESNTVFHPRTIKTALLNLNSLAR